MTFPGDATFPGATMTNTLMLVSGKTGRSKWHVINLTWGYCTWFTECQHTILDYYRVQIVLLLFCFRKTCSVLIWRNIVYMHYQKWCNSLYFTESKQRMTGETLVQIALLSFWTLLYYRKVILVRRLFLKYDKGFA